MSWCVFLFLLLVSSVAQRPSFAFRSFLQRIQHELPPQWDATAEINSPLSSNFPSAPKFVIPDESLKESFKQTIEWFNDLAPPSFDYTPNPRATMVHFCFLLHGHRGLSRDLAYLQTRMHEQAKEVCGDDQDMVVHASVCNEGKTTDGVKLGGERLKEEIIEVIRDQMRERNTTTITVSIVGNSLGGVYGRYAIAKLVEMCEPCADDPDVLILDGKYRMYMNIFCTTATPHLGVAGHTFVRIPRTAEIGVAHAMGDTGRDLFRLNDLLKSMATCPSFLKPLGSFRKRIAYANAYGTDFPVPAHTAAFLSKASVYPHHFRDEDNNGKDDRLVVDESINGLVVATLHTPPLSEEDSTNLTLHHDNDTDDDDDVDLVLMSTSLDSLGWKKVFIDIRKEIPKIPLPPMRLRRRSADISSEEETNEEDVELFHLLRARRVVGSKDVAAAVTKPMFFESQFHWPMGHNMIVAFSRSRFSSYLNRAGRPFVDGLARELVQDIFSYPDFVKEGQRKRVSVSGGSVTSGIATTNNLVRENVS